MHEEEEIIQELTSQAVVEVYKLKKKLWKTITIGSCVVHFQPLQFTQQNRHSVV